MNITRFTDYSLRVLIYLALQGQESITIKDVADRYGISKNHLMKVVQELSAKGYLNATRGKKGGIRLSQDPKQINIGKLVRMIEQDSTLVECFGADNRCVIAPACQLKRMFAEAMDSFFQCLEQYTLADLIAGTNRKRLQQLLIVEPTTQVTDSLSTAGSQT